jgi:phospholipid/cholesterol/gamma-HCH transport system substrate-binding protein
MIAVRAKRLRHRLPALVAALVAVALLAGCQYNGASDLPLPGGATAGHDTYKLSAVFDNVQQLVKQGSVQVNNADVGSVDAIKVIQTKHGPKALVKMSVRKDVKLPANTVATLKQTTLLGEKFVALGAPPGAKPHGHLKPGTRLTSGNTLAYPDVEQVFGLLASVLNGGGLQKVRTITTQLNDALTGHEQDVRSLLKRLNTFVGGLDDNKSQVVRALNGLDHLSTTLAKQKQTIATALTDIGPGLKVLANQRAQLVALLQGLSHLGQVATKVINASEDNTAASLRKLQPILGKLAKAGDSVPYALELLLTFPFPKSTPRAIPGDFAGLYATLDIGPKQLLNFLMASGPKAPLNPSALSGHAKKPATSKAATPKVPKPKASKQKASKPKVPSLGKVSGKVLQVPKKLQQQLQQLTNPTTHGSSGGGGMPTLHDLLGGGL